LKTTGSTLETGLGEKPPNFAVLRRPVIARLAGRAAILKLRQALILYCDSGRWLGARAVWKLLWTGDFAMPRRGAVLAPGQQGSALA